VQDPGVEKPRSKSQLTCPMMGGKKMCTVCHKCNFWEHVRGANPNTGEAIDRWDCTLKLQYIMQMENNKFTYELGAAVESLRNQNIEYQRLALRMQYRDDPDALADLNRQFKLMDAKIATMLQLGAQQQKPLPPPTHNQQETDTDDFEIKKTVELDRPRVHRTTAGEGAKPRASRKPRTKR